MSDPADSWIEVRQGSQGAGVLGRLFRLLWFPFGYVLFGSFKL